MDSSIEELFVKAAGEVPVLVRRRIFFSHRDMDAVLKDYLKGKKFYLYTGRGPSGPMHIGHIIPFLFTKWLQDKFRAELYIQMTSDEKFMYHEELSASDIRRYTYDNMLDIIALGFDEVRTFIIDDIVNIHYLYPLAVSIARKINFSVVKAVFGFTDSTNIGMIFFPAVQAVPSFIGYFTSEENENCLIPAAIDQDPYWRVTRDIAPKIGLPKPAQIHGKFLPSLRGGGKMSSSQPETSIYLSDGPNDIRIKVWNAFTGGRPTVREQRELGGNPEICRIYSYFYFLFVQNPDELMKIYNECRSGERICGDCKEELTGMISRFLADHKKRREEARDKVDRYMLHNKIPIGDIVERAYSMLR